MLTDLIIMGLATWRLSSLIATPGDDGPWEMFLKFRNLVGVRHDEQTGLYYGTNEFAKGIMCVWCVSVWIGIALTILYYFFHDPVVWCSFPFALSGTAVIVERIANG